MLINHWSLGIAIFATALLIAANTRLIVASNHPIAYCLQYSQPFFVVIINQAFSCFLPIHY